MRRLLAIAVGIALLAATVLTLLLLPVLTGGVSAREEPTALEAFLARRLRTLAIPRGARDVKNPVPLTSSALASGRAHFADHCAACHANDGSGQTQIGQNLYPKAPDMRQPATQSLADGELFYIIENGIRMTGMPAWGTGVHGTSEETWHLVHFIRHLPKLTAAELEAMEQLNPRSVAEEAAGEHDTQHFHNAPGRLAPTRKPHEHQR